MFRLSHVTKSEEDVLKKVVMVACQAKVATQLVEGWYQQSHELKYHLPFRSVHLLVNDLKIEHEPSNETIKVSSSHGTSEKYHRKVTCHRRVA